MGPDCQALPCVRRCSWWVPAVRGANRFVFFVRTHFLACEGVAGGSQQSGGNVFFTKYGGPSGGSPLSGGEIIILHIIGGTSLLRPWTQLSASPRPVHVRWKSFLDHVDHATPRALGRWTMARPRKGTTQSRGKRGSGCPCREEYEGSLVHCGVRLLSLQNNRGCG